MTDASDGAQSRRFLIASGITLFVVFVTRALAFPHSWWLGVEPLLGIAVRQPDPLAGHPPAPGFPLYLELARALMFKAETPFVALVVAAFLSSAAASLLLAAALRRATGDAVGGALGALTFLMTPAMLVFSSTPAPEASALMFYGAAIVAAGRIVARESSPRRDAAILGAAAACAAGCQPEWALAAGVLVLAPLVRGETRRLAAISIVLFGGALMLLFAPLAEALGGEAALLRWLWRLPVGSTPFVSRAVMDACGPLWLSVPIVGLAIAGALFAARGREARLLLVVAPAVAHLALLALRGSAREPVLAIVPVSVALVALCVRGVTELSSRAGQPFARIAIVAAYCLVSWIWTAPLLRARLDVAPPPSKAAIWVEDHLDERGDAVVLVDGELLPHASALITKARVAPLGSGAGASVDARFAIVQGESTEAGAVVFSWPDSAPLRMLAGSRLRVVSAVPLRPEVAPR